MTDPLAAAIAALAHAAASWRAEGWQGGASLRGISNDGLVAGARRLGEARRFLDAAMAAAAAETARRSSPDAGRDGLSRQEGFRTPAAMVADVTGTTYGEAVRLLEVGTATSGRDTTGPGSAETPHPFVADAVARGMLGVAAAAAIVSRLAPLIPVAGRAAVLRAEETLVGRAIGLRLDRLQGLLATVEAELDPDGVAGREDDLRTARTLHLRRDASGMVSLVASLDPESAAYVHAAIDGMVSSEWRRGGGDGNGVDRSTIDGSRIDGSAVGQHVLGGHDGRDSRAASDGGAAPVSPDVRTPAQRRADALVDLCRHALGCDRAPMDHATTTVVVRIDVDALVSGVGAATIDGLDQPVSVATVRRMAAAGAVIPWALGGDSDILDWGRARRLFTPAQRLALVERDGGCACCGHPPSFTEVHHIRWWHRDAGPTDLSNGVLLCTRCHHRIHDDGWEIRVAGTGVGAAVSFIPPTSVDASRTPRPAFRAHRGVAA